MLGTNGSYAGGLEEGSGVGAAVAAWPAAGGETTKLQGGMSCDGICGTCVR